MTPTIYEEIQQERKRQDEQWGGPDHDDRNNQLEWIGIITRHLGKALISSDVPLLSRIQLIRVAALAVAAVEWIDRKIERTKI